jgi:hypothetical protein
VFLPNSRAVGGPSFAVQVQQIFQDLYPLCLFTSELGAKWREKR